MATKDSKTSKDDSKLFTETFGEGAYLTRTKTGEFNVFSTVPASEALGGSIDAQLKPGYFQSSGKFNPDTGVTDPVYSKKWDFDKKTGTYSLGDKKVTSSDLGMSNWNPSKVPLGLAYYASKAGANQDSWSDYSFKQMGKPGATKVGDVVGFAKGLQADLPKITSYESKPSGWDKVGNLAFDAALTAFGVPPIIAGGMSGAVGASESGGNILKGTLGGMAGGAISQYVPNVNPTNSSLLNSMASGAIKGGLRGGVSAGLGGRSIGSGMKTGLLSGGIGSGLSSMLSGTGMPSNLQSPIRNYLMQQMRPQQPRQQQLQRMSQQGRRV